MTSIFIFISGSVLLIYSAEKLIGYLVGVASGLKVSIFLLAIVFTGIEFDDVFLGVALNLEDVDDVALGIVLGTAISMTGIVLALAAILTPTKVNIPRDYLLVFALAPVLMIVFVLMAPLGAVEGIALLGLFGTFLTYVAVRESRGDKPVFRDAEMYEAYIAVRASRGAGTDTLTGTRPPVTGGRPGGEAGRDFSETAPFSEARRRSGWAGLGLAILALAGLIIGAATTGIGTEGILEDYGLEGTIFGATIATVVLTIEDVFLTVEPARKGAPEIGVGNVIGSVIFSVTGKLGIIVLAGGIVIAPDVLFWHLPALIVLTGFAGYVLYTGELKRRHGYILLAFYVLYWVVSFAAFGTAPVDAD
jgi:cation:H+ antiporter